MVRSFNLSAFVLPYPCSGFVDLRLIHAHVRCVSPSHQRRRVASDDLAQLFVDLGFEDVNPFLASGNVVFESEGDPRALETRIETHLGDTLGYDVPTFVRSLSDVDALANASPFDASVANDRMKTYIVFSKSTLEAEHEDRLADLATDVDRFAAGSRDIFWLRDLDAGESIPTGELEAALDLVLTRRTIRTLERIVDKYG